MPTLHEKVTYAIMNAFFSRPIEEQYFNASPSDNEDLGRAAINAMCDEIERLQKQVEHFHQAMVKEAEARYAAETEIERLRAAVRICIMLFANEQMATYEFLGELRELADGPF